MTDRVIPYAGAIVRSADVLNTNLFSMIGLGALARATLGSGTAFDGLLCHQTAPSASMAVTVDPGAVFSPQVIDSVAYGSLGTNANPLIKVGINTAPVNFSLTAPGTAGTSINYLIEASFLEQDDTPVVLPYYNSANPAVPFGGPSNNQTPQNTLRQQTVALQLKAGTPATTGSQTTPSVDNGWFGLWIVTVNNGQTSITNSSIGIYPGAMFVPAKLEGARIRCDTDLNLYVNSAGSDANSGLAAAFPKATISAAVQLLYSAYDMNGHNVTINVTNGTYNESVTLSGAPVGLGQGVVTLLGNTTTPANCIIAGSSNPAVSVFNNISPVINGFTLKSSGSGNAGYGLAVAQYATANIQNITFATSATGGIDAYSATVVGENTNITFSGTMQIGVLSNNGNVNIGFSHITFSGGATFTNQFALVYDGGILAAPSETFTGSFTGQRYNVNTGGVIDTNTVGNTSYFPGSVAGTNNGGAGQYV